MSINTNLNALRAVRRLDEAGSARGRTFERLASGSRINHAGDDAAGLAVASSLNFQTKVHGQAVRNVSDGASFLNIADGAAKELKGILFRLRELASQSSNGSFSNVQRASLDKEAQALQGEYNRVVATAKFNGASVFGGPVSVQAGTGVDAVLLVGATTAGTATAVVGDGTFQAMQSFASGSYPFSAFVADFDGDGVPDLVSANQGGNTLSVLLGNGDGTFQARKSFASGIGPYFVSVADLNGDGVADLVSANGHWTGSTLSVLLGNGVTTATAQTSLTPLAGIDVATQGAALSAQGRIDAYLDEVVIVSGFIGVGLSRLAVASANLQFNIEAAKAAESRIIDADVAEESARLVSTGILRQAAAAVLAQALKGPELALKLLQA